MTAAIRIKLSTMMFLEFFIWGAWFVTMGTYLANTLHASGVQNANAYASQAWGAILAPFIIGLIADRYFSAQKILGILHIIGAGVLYYASVVNNFAAFYPNILLYLIIYMPTIALANSVAFKQLTNPNKEFPFIRIFGAAGSWAVRSSVSLTGSIKAFWP
jgi:fucose permease